jgi:hypothetical protein
LLYRLSYRGIYRKACLAQPACDGYINLAPSDQRRLEGRNRASSGALMGDLFEGLDDGAVG